MTSLKVCAGGSMLCMCFSALPVKLKLNIHVWLHFCSLEKLPFDAVKLKSHFAHFRHRLWNSTYELCMAAVPESWIAFVFLVKYIWEVSYWEMSSSCNLLFTACQICRISDVFTKYVNKCNRTQYKFHGDGILLEAICTLCCSDIPKLFLIAFRWGWSNAATEWY